jgi:hypothetical protein
LPEGKKHLEEIDIDSRILEWILRTGQDGVDWINLTVDKGQWKILVNTVIEPSGSIISWEPSRVV